MSDRRDLEDYLENQKEALAAKRELYAAGLPHLFGHKMYAWQRIYFESMNRMNLLRAPNQGGKSYIQIRKAVHWSTERKLWNKLWPNQTPRQFWYFYPDEETVAKEYTHKWVPEVLPRNEFKDHPKYGWEKVPGKRRGVVAGIKFNSGIELSFHTYGQRVLNLQAGSIAAIFCDEELPEDFYDELNARLYQTRGYWHMCWTSTRTEDMWVRAIDGKGESELFPDALKLNISMYDCQVYEDGTPGVYPEERIKEIIASCRNRTEIDRRVMGNAPKEGGLKYHAFDPARHYVSADIEIPESWHRRVGIDLGSGSERKHQHPPAICFIAIRPDYKLGYVYKGWIGDDGRNYTAGDVFNMYIKLRGGEYVPIRKYDQASKDFRVIAERNSEPFIASAKNHELGEEVINTLFANDMMYILDLPELRKLGNEMTSLLRTTLKRNAKDDFCFSGGTLVHTASGDKRIEDIAVGDFVLTRDGWRRVMDVASRFADTCRYRYGGRTFQVTSNHRFYSCERGFVPIGDMLGSDTPHVLTYREAFIWHRARLLSLMELSSEGIRSRLISLIEAITAHQGFIGSVVLARCIRRFGGIITVLFLLVTRCIIRIMIPWIIVWRTWNVFVGVGIRAITNAADVRTRCIVRGLRRIYQRFATWPKSGIVVKKAANGTRILAGFLGRGVSLSRRFVQDAVQSLRPSHYLSRAMCFVGTGASQLTDENLALMTSREAVNGVTGYLGRINIPGQDIVRGDVLSVEGFKCSEVVYSLSVDGVHEYYANGVLVANCDAFRYALADEPFDWSAIMSKKDKELGIQPKKPITEKEMVAMEIAARRGEMYTEGEEKEGWSEFDDEIDFYNELCGS